MKENVVRAVPAGPEPPTPQPEPKHIKFVADGCSKSGKTKVWKVLTKDGDLFLGYVRWYGAWRCYSFFVSSKHGEFEFVFEKTCLRDIASFCENQTQQHRGGLA